MQRHIAQSPSVPLLEDSDYSFVEIRFTENANDVNLVGGSRFVASIAGKSVLLFGNNPDYTFVPHFKVIETVEWDDERNVVSCRVGSELTGVDFGHDEDCGAGYVFFERAPYDATPEIYDRHPRWEWGRFDRRG